MTERLGRLPRVDLFTDGACRKTGEGGWGFILRHAATGSEIEGSGGATGTTSQRMELQAALSGLQRLTRPCDVTLTSDSQYLVRGLNEWLASWVAKGWRTAAGEPVKNRDLWELLHAEAKRHTIVAKWVKGHAGHPENERCDALATAAVRSVSAPGAG